MTKPVVVHKYGGTSLADPVGLQSCAQNIKAAQEKGLAPVVVVSAMGRRGDPYATDTLLDFAFSVNEEPAQRELDLLAACGEIISAVMLALTLQKLGCQAMALTGPQAGIFTNSQFGTAEITRIDTNRILKLTETDVVPVICGFQGINPAGDTTTLGRGGSDISAVAVAGALYTNTVTIYTDVATVKTADPKLVTNALPIYRLNYQEVLEMAVEGARVIHPRAVELAMAQEITILITSLTESSDHQTEIGPRCTKPNGEAVIRAITHLGDISLFSLERSPKHVAEILAKIAESGIFLDMVNLAEYRQSFAVKQSWAEQISRLLSKMEVNFIRKDQCCKISIIGAGIRGMSGVVARIYGTMAKKEVSVLQSSDSFTQIAILIPQEKAREAVNSLHELFFGEGEEK